MCCFCAHAHIHVCLLLYEHVTYHPGHLVSLYMHAHTGMLPSLAPAVVTVSVAVKSMAPEPGGRVWIWLCPFMVG